MKSKLLLLACFIAVLNSTLARQSAGNGKITGTVVDESSGKPVEFATIAVQDPATGKPINGTVADDKGRFTVNKVAEGKYRVVISFIGYESIVLNDIVVSDRKDNIDLGVQKLATTAQQLDEVVVEGQRALVEEKVDRTIYNAENDATARGGDATDVLRRVPMLSVDLDGNVSLRGNQNITVLINNKPSTIAASSVADALKQIPSDQIKSVEVITSPSAKYDAEGSAGIINIITKKTTIEGFTLSVDGSAGVRGSNLGLNGSYRLGKMGFSLGGFGRSNYNVTGNFRNEQFSYDENGNLQTVSTQQADTRDRGLFGNYTLGWDYDINKFNSLTASVRYGARNRRNFQDQLLSQTFDNNETLLRSSLQNVDVKDLSGTVDANLTYTRAFETKGREFSILTSYSRNDRTNDFVNITLDQTDLSTSERLKNDNESFNEEITLQADYVTPLGDKQIVEVGGKNISRRVSSKFKYFSAVGEGDFTLINNPNLSNDFFYNQNVSAAYLSYTLSLPQSVSLKTGARYEYTTIDANFQNQEKIDIPSYGVLVPSANLSKRLKNGNTVKLAYNRRIQRPSLRFLNPNIQAPNPLNVTIGNPSLEPEFTNNFELSYSTFIKSTSINLSTFARNTNNAIQGVRDVIGNDPTDLDTLRTQFANIGKENAYGASAFVNVNISQKLTLSGGGDIYYATLSNNNPDPVFNASNNGWVYNVRMFGSYNFTKEWGLQFFGFYRGRDVQLQGLRGGFAVYSLALRREFADRKGSIGIGAENFFNFNGFRIKNETVSPVVVQNSVNVLDNISVKVTFSYRIGKLSFDGQPRRRRSINNDDLKSEGDGGGMDTGGGMGQSGGGGMPRGGSRSPVRVMPTANTSTPGADANATVEASGTWNYTVESPQGGSGKIVIVKEGDKLTGTVTNSRNNRETAAKSVTLNGNEITINYEVNFGGNTMEIVMKGVIKDDALTGTMSVGQFGNFPLNAKREK